ncbi:MAG: iron ABC transporter substrate-binding protein [Acidobacteria bacterium]|nr:iron ABC transporter substrate-binding protein [Acidobacteriota bacterium]
MNTDRRFRVAVSIAAFAVFASACSSSSNEVVTVYSGRSENLIGPILDSFTEDTGIKVAIRYGQSAELALLIEQEGDRSPADVFISQSPGAMGYVQQLGMLQTLADDIIALVPAEFANADGQWVGMSGRVRVIVYNNDLIDLADLPDSVFDLTDEIFRGKVGVAPANGSFQDFVTAMREISGDDKALEWLEGLVANDAQTYTNNTAILAAVSRGEIPLGLVNHYYNYRALAEDPSLPTENFFFKNADIGSLVIVTALGIVRSDSTNLDIAQQLVAYLLSEKAQTFFSENTFEYPLASGVAAAGNIPVLADLEVATYDLDSLGGGLTRTKELIDQSGLEDS